MMTSPPPRNFKVQRGQRGEAKRGEVPRPTVPALLTDQKVIDGRSSKALQCDPYAAWESAPNTPVCTWRPIQVHGCGWWVSAKAGRAGECHGPGRGREIIHFCSTPSIIAYWVLHLHFNIGVLLGCSQILGLC